MAVGRRAAHLVSYWIARKVNDPKYVGIFSKTRIGQRFQFAHGTVFSEVAQMRWHDYNSASHCFSCFQWKAEYV